MKGSHRDESLRWLTQAQDEFDDAEGLRRIGRFYLALFHYQQAAEKALKAYLYLMVGSREVFTTHSLEELLAMVREIAPEFKEVMAARALDRYSISTRYPDALPGKIPSRYFRDPQEAEKAMLLSKVVVDLATRMIGEGAP